MIENIVKQIMANVAQFTNLFDTTTQSASASLISNTITIAGLNGEYVLTGGIDGVASKGCFNGIHNFVAGVALTDCFFGNVATVQTCTYHKVNVGTAISRDYALESIIDDKTPNTIIAYWSGTQNTKRDFNYSISQDGYTQLNNTFGVIFKIKATQLEALGGYDILDLIIANSIIDTGVDGASLVKFDSVKERFFAGDYYCVDFAFSYLQEMAINDIIRERVKHFNAVLDNFTTEII